MNQYVLPVFNRDGARRGYVVRSDGWRGDPPSPRKSGLRTFVKARTFMEGPSEVQQSWYRPTLQALVGWDGKLHIVPAETLGRTIVLVEDQVSAMKAAQAGVTGVALLGVDLSYDKIRELQQAQPTQVIVALDQDAAAKGFELVRNFSPAFRSMRVALLEHDLKDLPRTEVLSALGLSA